MNGNIRKNLKEGREEMAIPKGKQRITITIHKETKQLLNNLLSLHSKPLTASNMFEIALLLYAKACMGEIEKLEADEQEKEKN